MWIIGCDFHPSFQQVAYVNTEGGECGNRRLGHMAEAEQFYRSLGGQVVRVGMEASGQSRWFERLLAELGYELWVGDPAKIRATQPRKQKTDERDAEDILELLLTERFTKLRIRIPSAGERDARQLVAHRHRLVQMRTRVKNQLKAVALNEGMVARRPGFWSQQGQEQFRALRLPEWTAQRREDNLALLADLERRTEPLEKAVKQQAWERPEVVRLMTHPGVGPVTGLAFVLTLGDPHRFSCGRKVASYLGLIPAEDTSGGKQRLGHLTKQGNALLRGLLVEAAHSAVQKEPELKRCYRRLAMKKNRAIAAVAVARKLAVRLWWMWRRGLDYEQMYAPPVRMQGKPGLAPGVK
jgi:transposase